MSNHLLQKICSENICRIKLFRANLRKFRQYSSHH